MSKRLQSGEVDMHSDRKICSDSAAMGQPEAIRRRFLFVFYGHRYRKLPNGRRVAKSTGTLTAKYAYNMQSGPARGSLGNRFLWFFADRLQPGPASKLSLGRPPRPDPQISPNRHGSKHTLKSDSRRPSKLILRLRLGRTPFLDPLGECPRPLQTDPGTAKYAWIL